MKNYLFKRSPFLPVMFILIFLSSCLKENEFKYETTIPGDLLSLDIADAKALIIANGTNDTGNALYKLLNNGTLEEIRYYIVDTLVTQTQDGTVVELDSAEISRIVYPVQIQNISSEYLMISLRQENPQQADTPFEYNFVARKSDGKLYRLSGFIPVEGNDPEYDNMFRNRLKSVQRDNEGNYYYLGEKTVHRLNIDNINNISLVGLTPAAGEGATNFRVNGKGDLIVTSGGIDSERVIRYFVDGMGLSNPEFSFLPYWVGPDKEFYYAHNTTANYPEIGRLTFSGTLPVYQSMGTLQYPQLLNSNLEQSYFFRLTNPEKVVIISNPEASQQANNPAMVAEVYNSEMTPVAFALSDLGINEVDETAYSNRFYYLSGVIAGVNGIIKVDPSVFPHTATSLLQGNDIQVVNLAVSNNDMLLFHGMKGDGTYIIGEVSPAGVFTEYPSVANEILQLIPLQ